MILDHGDDLGLAIVQTVQTIEDVRVDLGSCTVRVLLQASENASDTKVRCTLEGSSGGGILDTRDGKRERARLFVCGIRILLHETQTVISGRVCGGVI
jgi:hypothetical protein